jgi:hypothetical protein
MPELKWLLEVERTLREFRISLSITVPGITTASAIDENFDT